MIRHLPGQMSSEVQSAGTESFYIILYMINRNEAFTPTNPAQEVLQNFSYDMLRLITFNGQALHVFI